MIKLELTPTEWYLVLVLTTCELETNGSKVAQPILASIFQKLITKLATRDFEAVATSFNDQLEAEVRNKQKAQGHGP